MSTYTADGTYTTNGLEREQKTKAERPPAAAAPFCCSRLSHGSEGEQVALVRTADAKFYIQGPEPGKYYNSRNLGATGHLPRFDEHQPIRLFFQEDKVAGLLKTAPSLCAPQDQPTAKFAHHPPPPPPPPPPASPPMHAPAYSTPLQMVRPAPPAATAASAPYHAAADHSRAAASSAAAAAAGAAALPAPHSVLPPSTGASAAPPAAAAPAAAPVVSSTAALLISPNFLRDLTHQHDWEFGALAELVHNSRDAKAKNCRISVQRLGALKKPHLIVSDDGVGMTHQELKVCIIAHQCARESESTEWTPVPIRV